MKVAIIGLGAISAVHIKVLTEQGHDIVAVCDVSEDRLKNYPNIKGYTDFNKMLDEEKLNAVHICTPHYLHAEMIIACLNRDINVLCEKPLCIDLNDGQRIIDAQNKSKAILGVAHQNRYNPSSLYVKDFLSKNPPITAYATVAWERGEDYYKSADWRGKYRTEGGGVLINQALHTLDLLQWLLGMPKSVCAVSAALKLKDVVEVEDTVCASFCGEHDFQFFATNCAQVDFPIEIIIKTKDNLIRLYSNSVSIDGKEIELDSLINQVYACKEDNGGAKVYGKQCYGGGHFSLIKDFYHSIECGKGFEIDGEEAFKVVRLIEAVYCSNGEKIYI